MAFLALAVSPMPTIEANQEARLSYMGGLSGGSWLSTIITNDAARIIGQVVTGIGFLGAGIIFREGLHVHGLTPAATVWCSSAVGYMAGTGLYVTNPDCDGGLCQQQYHPDAHR